MPRGKGHCVCPNLHWCVAYLLRPQRLAHSFSSGSCHTEAGIPCSAGPRSSGCSSAICMDGVFSTHFAMIRKIRRKFSFCDSTVSRSRGFSHGSPHGQLRSRTGWGPVCRRCLERDQVEVLGTAIKAARFREASSHESDVIASAFTSATDEGPFIAGHKRCNSAPVSRSPTKPKVRGGIT